MTVCKLDGRLKPLLGWQGQEKPVINHCVGIMSCELWYFDIELNLSTSSDACCSSGGYN